MTGVKIARTDAIRQFRAALEQRGILPPEHIIGDGRLRRCDAEGRNGKGDAAYVLHLDHVPTGGFQNWRDGMGWNNWRADLGRVLTTEEEAAHRRYVKLTRAKQKREDARRKAEAAAKANTIWSEASPDPDHSYLCRKRVKSYGLRAWRGKILIPVRDVEDKLHSLQFVGATGTKKFLTGGRIQGCFFIIGEPGDVILVGEGYASCGSAHEDSGYASVVAFDCGNLKAVATAIRAKYPLARLVVLADDDYRTAGNPGLTKAREAAAAVGGVVAVPDFGADRPAAATDFNDLAQHAGRDAVRRCIGAALAANNREGDGPDTDVEIARLAALPVAQYERQREPAAKKLGFRVSILDKIVLAERGGGAVSGQGRRLELDEPEPWPEPVDGAELLDAIVAGIRRYVVLDSAGTDAVALWILAVHEFDQFFIFPRLFIWAPEKGCGKTTLLIVIGFQVPRKLSADNITAAALFRTIEVGRPTLLLDEADTYMRNSEDMRGVVDSGHRRDGGVIRTVGDAHEPRRFSTWAAMVLAAIGHLPGTVEDRSIKIPMRRRRPDEPVASLRLDRPSEFEKLARMAARWARDHANELHAADPAMPGKIYNRVADNWHPLFAVADIAGGDWPERARNAALRLSLDDEDSISKGVLLLGDLRGQFDSEPSGVLFTQDILTALRTDETRPWSEWKNDKPITDRQLAALLKPYKIKPKTVRGGDQTDKGYRHEWFEDSFASYLPARSVTASQADDSAGIGFGRSVTTSTPVTHNVTDANRENPGVSAGCDGVTDREPEEAGEWRF
jgi:putative DNA primase/helicase